MAEYRPTSQFGDRFGEIIRDRFIGFLREFRSDEDFAATQSSEALPTYIKQIHLMKENDRTTLAVDFCHVKLHDEPLALAFAEEYARYVAIFSSLHGYSSHYDGITVGTSHFFAWRYKR